ncbi:MAG TPA: L-seryl-tRNA(Sec) selenium transferase [Tepidisphaeraceae bacterium]|nr:L-seryl-tRNA(Sec) selenium transferase [Tepidisphaeraceae bacterium]
MSRASQRPSLRDIPSVDRILRDLGEQDLPRPAVLAVVRRELGLFRAKPSDPSSLMPRIAAALDHLRLTCIQPVINGTGIIIHTNFGRSPLARVAIDALTAVAADYNNLEYDLATGNRGNRAAYVEHNLAILCGADAATVVNNCAAALVLILRHFTAKPPRTEVIISRGELVQIGGGFRVPEILEASGATLREIGTTNKTTIDDYRAAIDADRTAMVLRVHRSNFYMGGFVEAPSSREIAELTRRAEVPFVEDLGSGATFDTQSLGGGERETMPAEAIEAGADIICFSGDKLLGGPQAGIIAGHAARITALKGEPFFRALRCDKLILSALQATVDVLLSGRVDEIPIRALMDLSMEQLQSRAQTIAADLAGLRLDVKITPCESQVGGGSLPRTSKASLSIDLAVSVEALDAFAQRLRLGRPPVIGYIAGGRLRFDLRTIFPRQDEAFTAAIRTAAVEAGRSR